MRYLTVLSMAVLAVLVSCGASDNGTPSKNNDPVVTRYNIKSEGGNDYQVVEFPMKSTNATCVWIQNGNGTTLSCVRN